MIFATMLLPPPPRLQSRRGSIGARVDPSPPPSPTPPSHPRRAWRFIAPLIVLALGIVGILEIVRGNPVVSPMGARQLDAWIARLAARSGTINSQADLDMVGTIAAGLTREEGRTPGPFYLQYLPELDALEKLHHMVHEPFTGIRRMYCDIWIDSLVTYGRLERTWGMHAVYVRPSLQLPVMVLLLDRLGREKSALSEHLEAPFEATQGMSVHTLPGRARLWMRLMDAATRHVRLGAWIANQLDRAEPGWTDGVEVRLWSRLCADPGPEALRALAEPCDHPAGGKRFTLAARSWSEAERRISASWTPGATTNASQTPSAATITPAPPGSPVSPDRLASPALRRPSSPGSAPRATGPAPDPPMFEDVTARAGVSFTHVQSAQGRVVYLPESLGSGCAMVDYDGDGKLDLFFVQGSGPTDGKAPATIPMCKLYRNKGDGTFEDVTVRVGLDIRGWGMGCLWFDYDNDGRPDLFVTNFGGTNRLFHQEPDHTFKDVTKAAGLYDPRNIWSTGAAAIDFDRDGHLDLYVCGYSDFETKNFINIPRLVSIQNSALNQPFTLSPFAYPALPNHLYRNKGDGTFEDVTARAGVADAVGKSLGVMAADLDGDGWMDLLVANDVTPKALYINKHDGTFEDAGRKAWIDDTHGSMGLAAGDIDGDGALDVLCTHWVNEDNGLYRNNVVDFIRAARTTTSNRRLTFTEIAEAAGITEPTRSYVGWGCALADLDNDGILDEVHVNGHTFLDDGQPRRLIPQESMVFLGRGNRTFRRLHFGPDDPISIKRVGRGLAVGDFDGDGWLDLLITQNNGPASLLRHIPLSGRHWLEIALEGTRSNRDAVGAVARVRAGRLNMIRARVSGESYLSCHSPILHFGLGSETAIDALTVRWPSGQAESFPAPGIDRLVHIKEGSGRSIKQF